MQGVPALSIVLPVLNEAAGIVAALQALAPLRSAGAEVIVVDGGSTDRSAEPAAPLADQVLEAPRGRASQMNAGAAAARGGVLLFLHADTRLPEGADRFIAQAMAAGRHWGRFDVRIEGKSNWLPLVAAMMNLRSRLTGVATGDQAMFVTREAFAAAGGFPDIPLMEDIELSRRLLRTGRPACLAARVTTSGRRWEAHGVWRTIRRMWWLRLRYFLGADPQRLAVEYGYAPANPEAPLPVGVAILARAPVAGRAKTRLIPLLGAEGAAGLQAWMLERVVATALAADVGPVTLWCEGDPGHRAFVRCRELGPLRIRPQVAGDLGRRMLAAVEESPAAAGTLVIGTDCPVLGAAHLREAARALAERDAVLIPAEDGGYVLIGMKVPAAGAFAGIDWGSPQVMAQTRQALDALGWRRAELATLWDVDRAEDVQRLAAMFPEIRKI